jgi:hypothetical protein
MTAGGPDTHVFSGDWLLSTNPGSSHLYREGFAGTPVTTWNGWQVFTVTPQVMHAIVGSHQADVTTMITAAVARGADPQRAWLDSLRHLASVFWLGTLVVVDSRVLQDDPTQLEVIAPDAAGRYRVGFGWSWDRVRPAHVHTIHRDQASTGRRA